MYKKRTLQLFYILASAPDEYRTSKELSEMANVTDRTIKGDIRELSNLAYDLGARIISHKGKGYRLEIEDEEVFKNAYEQLEYHFYSNYINDDVIENRVIDILRLLVTSENYMTVDDIADEIFVAKSSIREEMAEVNHLLELYHLRLKHKSEDGPMLKGSELNRRLLMLYLYDNSFHDAKPVYVDGNISEFYDFFEYDDSKRKEIRHVFLHILRQHHIRIVEALTPVVCRYLCLLVNRYHNGYYVRFDDEDKKLIDGLKEMQVARIVFDELKAYEGYDTDENEIYALALILASYRDIDEDISYLSKEGINEIREIIDNVFIVINNRYNIDFKLVNNSEKYLIRAIAPMMIQKRFDISGADILRNQFNRTGNVFPISILFSRVTDEVFKSKYGCQLSELNTYFISAMFQRLLFAVDYELRKINAMVISGNGIGSANMIYDFINNRYGNMFNKLDCYELYEPREIPPEEYDWIIGYIPEFSYRYMWPLFITDPIPTAKQINGIYNEVVLSGVDFKGILHNLHYENIDIMDGFNIRNMDTFRDIISYKHGKDMESIKHIKDNIRYRSVLVDKTMIIFIDRVDTRNSVFEVYLLSDDDRLRNHRFNKIVVLTLDAHDSLETIRFMNDCLFMICIRTDECLEIIRNDGVDGLTKIVKLALKSLPISLNQGK